MAFPGFFRSLSACQGLENSSQIFRISKFQFEWRSAGLWWKCASLGKGTTVWPTVCCLLRINLNQLSAMPSTPSVKSQFYLKIVISKFPKLHFKRFIEFRCNHLSIRIIFAFAHCYCLLMRRKKNWIISTWINSTICWSAMIMTTMTTTQTSHIMHIN